jgi:PEGA domain
MSSPQTWAFRKLAVLIPWLALAFLCSAFASTVCAQAVAEAAGANSVSASVASSIKAPAMPKFPGTGAGPSSSPSSASPHLIASSGPPPEETNRKTLEASAGKDPGKLLLRATPVEAQIWVNGKIVGKTPLLLVLAAGKYQIEMRGSRGQTGKRSVDLLPRETRELAVKLDQLYPGRVTASR